jgi:DinB superfamily
VRRVIVPDDKDWTWVLVRECPECGFDASTCVAETVPDLVHANALAWRGFLESGMIRPGRPYPSTWSPLEYACHVRDVYQRYSDRIAVMLSEHDPLFANWDQDATATEERYEDQDPFTVVADLGTSAVELADRLAGLSSAEWQRPGRRSDGASFTVGRISRYMVHDTIHHVWDVTNPAP